MPQVDRSHIKVKALAVIMSPDGRHHAVFRGTDPTKTRPHFHRSPGGGVELVEDGVIPAEGRTYLDNGEPNWVEWRPIEGDPEVPLYPDGLQDLIDVHLR